MGNYVAVIILQYGNAESTIDCIKSVEHYNTYPVKYIIVDNGSPGNESVETVSLFLHSVFGGSVLELDDENTVDQPLPKATFIRSAVNDGYACGNNKGLAVAYADDEIDYVLILNNDILFVEDIVPGLVDDVDRLSNGAIISPVLFKKGLEEIDKNCARKEARFINMLIFNLLILHATKSMDRANAYDIEPMTGVIPIQLVSGSCMMCKKSVFKEINGFDPGTFLYYEENILWEKIKSLGLINYIDTDLKCIHLGAATIGKRMSRNVIVRTFKSQSYFVRRYMRNGFYKAMILNVSQWWVLAVLSVRHLFRWK